MTPDTDLATQGVRSDGTARVAPADGCAERQSTSDPSPAASEDKWFIRKLADAEAERDQWKRTSLHYESIAANAGLL